MLLYINIPVSQAVKKYILKENAHNIIDFRGSQVVKLNKKMFLGNYLSGLLDSQVKKPKYLKPSSFISFSLSHRVGEKKHLTEERELLVSYHLDQLFKFEFCRFINLYHSNPFGLPISEAMEMFYKLYELSEDDYSRETMRRYYNRYGKKREQKIEKNQNIFLKMSPDKLDFPEPDNCNFSRLKEMYPALTYQPKKAS